MPKIDIQQFFQAADSVQGDSTALKTDAQGRVLLHKQDGSAAPQNTATVRKESLRHLDAFWTAIKDSPLYGKTSANYVKALFDDARMARVPLTARLVQNVKYFLDEHVQMTIHDEVQAKKLIAPDRMDAFMKALLTGKLDLGNSRFNATGRAVASFLSMTSLTPEELHKQRRSECPQVQRAAISVGLYEMDKNTSLRHTLKQCTREHDDHIQTEATVRTKLNDQISLLEKVHPETLAALAESDQGKRIFRVVEKLISLKKIPLDGANKLVLACLRSTSEGNALRNRNDLNNVLNTYQRICQESVAQAPQTEKIVHNQVLASSPEVMRGMQHYLEKTHGTQNLYTEEQRREALHVASDVFSLANLEALNAAERNGLASKCPPNLTSSMMKTVASMNVVVNAILDKDAQVDEAFLLKLEDLSTVLHDAHMVDANKTLGMQPDELRRHMIESCIQGKGLSGENQIFTLQEGQDRLLAFSKALGAIATQVESGKLLSANLNQQGIFSVASRMLDDLRADFRTLGNELVRKRDGQMPVPAQNLAAPQIVPAPAPAPNLAALQLAPVSQESALEQLPEVARQALDALVPASNALHALPNAALKTLLTDIQRDRSDLARVPLDNLCTVRLRQALSQHLVSAQSSSQGQNLTAEEWQNHIRLGAENYVQKLADIMRTIDAQPEVTPRADAKAAFIAQHDRAPTKEELRELYNNLPQYRAVLTPAQKEIIKQTLPLYGPLDVDVVLSLANAASNNTDCADLALTLPTADNMAYAIDHFATTPLQEALTKVPCSPQNMRDAMDFFLDASLRMHSDAAATMPELQRRMASPEVRSLGAQLAFLHRTFCAQDSSEPQLSAKVSSTILTTVQVMEALTRVSNHNTGKPMPDEPGSIMRDKSILNTSQVIPRVYDMVKAPNSSVHAALVNAHPPLTNAEYQTLVSLADQLAPNKTHSKEVSQMLGLCAHRVLDAVNNPANKPELANLPILSRIWSAICGSPPASDLTEQNFAPKMLDLLDAKCLSLFKNKGIAKDSSLGRQYLNYGLDPGQLMRKSAPTFTLEDIASARELEATSITSSTRSAYGLAEELPRSGNNAIYSTELEGHEARIERKPGEDYNNDYNEFHIRQVTNMANAICGGNPDQSRMLLHLQTSTGTNALNFLAAFRDPNGFGDNLGTMHFMAERGENDHVTLHITNEPNSPVKYAKDWDISPDGTARLVKMELGSNPLYGSSLDNLRDVRLYDQPLPNAAPAAQASEAQPLPNAAPAAQASEAQPLPNAAYRTVLRTLTSAEDVDKALMVRQGDNTCFLASIINGMLRTEEGRQALKQRFQEGHLLVDDPKTGFTTKLRQSLEDLDAGDLRQAEELNASLNALNTHKEFAKIVEDSRRFSGLEIALMRVYGEIDHNWQIGRMGFAQDAAPLLGYDVAPDVDRSFERWSLPAGNPPLNNNDLRAENKTLLDHAVAGLTAPGHVPIIYKGIVTGNSTIGHYMAVVGTYGEENAKKNVGEFGLIVQDSITGLRAHFPLDSLKLKNETIVDGQVQSERVSLIMLQPRANKEQIAA